jgi:hypothetical protein
MPNDLVNLLLGLPLLLSAVWFARRGSLLGLLAWPGALLYAAYNYGAYVFGVPPGLLTILFLAVVLLSCLAVAFTLPKIDGLALRGRLQGHVGERSAGWVLVLFGALFAARAVGLLVGDAPEPLDLGLLVADLAISLLWVAGGALLLRRVPLGYSAAPGLLIAASFLFLGLILFLALQPLLVDVAFAPLDIAVVTLMALVCWVPCARFVRGVQRSAGGA